MDQAVDYMPIGKTTLYKLVKEGRIGFSRPEGKLCFKRKDMDAYLEETYQPSASEIAQRILRGERIPSRRRKRGQL